MKKMLLIRIPPPVSSVDGNTVVQWGKYTVDGSLSGALHLTTVAQLKAAWLAEEPEGSDEEDRLPDEIVLFLSGSLCFYKRLTMNAGQKKHLTTALPYLVEEHLAQDIETMHIVNGFPDKKSRVSVAAIPHAIIQALLALFEEYQLPLTRVMAEMQFLVSEPECISLLLDSDAVMMASPGHEAVTLDYQALSFLFPEHSGQGSQEPHDTLAIGGTEAVDEQPSQVKLMFPDRTLTVPTSRVEEVSDLLSQRGCRVEKIPLQSAVLEFFARQYFIFQTRNQLIDFRQGAYQCPRRAGRFLRRWWPVAAAVGCWLILELGLSVTEGIIYQQQSEALWQDSITRYLAVFPGDRQAQQAQTRQQMSFNIRQVMEHRFRNMAAKTSESPFLPMLQSLSTVSAAMGENIGLEPRSLDFNETSRQLVYEFGAGELATVNRFLEKLNHSGLQGKLENATHGESGVIARITIRK